MYILDDVGICHIVVIVRVVKVVKVVLHGERLKEEETVEIGGGGVKHGLEVIVIRFLGIKN